MIVLSGPLVSNEPMSGMAALRAFVMIDGTTEPSLMDGAGQLWSSFKAPVTAL